MTELSGPVGVRRGGGLITNAPADQGKVIDLLWRIGPEDGGMRGVTLKPGPGPKGKCDTGLANAIAAFQAFWVAKGEFKAADGVVSKIGKTLDKLDALASAAGPAPPSPSNTGFTDLKVLRFQQLMPVALVRGSAPSIEPASAIRFAFLPVPKGSKLRETRAGGQIFDLLFKLEKNGDTFWVGVAVPAGTTKFTRAYVYFHPATITPADDANYVRFGGRWPDVQRFVLMMGVQMAAVRAIPVIVPFMTNASRSNKPHTNLFADRAKDTLNDIMAAVQMTLGRTGKPETLEHIGVSSFSSGVDHLVDFGDNLAADNLIREQIDFDSPFQKNKVKFMHTIGATWWVTQKAPPHGPRLGWLHLPPPAFSEVQFHKGDTHHQIGFMMFQAMMVMSVIRHPPSP